MEPNWAQDESEVLLRASDPDHCDHAEAVVILFSVYVLPAAIARARQLPLTEESPEDLAQKVAEKFWKSLDRFRGDSSIRTYVTAMVDNTWKDQARRIRRRQRIMRIVPFPDPPGLVERDSVPFPQPEPVVLDDTTSVDLVSLFQTPGLTPKEQAVLHLTFVAGSTTDEIADFLRVTPRTVRRIRNSAINKLRERIADDEH